MLSRIPVKYVTSVFGIAIVAAITAYLGGNILQMMLAPVGGIALGLGAALAITQSKKLPPTATLGDCRPHVEGAGVSTPGSGRWCCCTIYVTWASAVGVVQFREDIYNRDGLSPGPSVSRG